MKPEEIYQDLISLAEKLQVTVSEQNFRKTGIKVKSGFCVVKGKNMFYMDKHKAVRKKIKLLAACLSEFPHEDIYVIPAVRSLLTKKSENEKEGVGSGL